MARSDYQSVDHYIAAQPAPARPTLERVRATIRKALPRATEGISYQIPVYKVDGAMVILTPLPAPGWEFLAWGGAAEGSATPAVIEMAGDTRVTALFVDVDDPAAGSHASSINEKLYPVHTAKVGGLACKILMTVSGIGLTLLGALATWSFWFRKAKKRKRPELAKAGLEAAAA